MSRNDQWRRLSLDQQRLGKLHPEAVKPGGCLGVTFAAMKGHGQHRRQRKRKALPKITNGHRCHRAAGAALELASREPISILGQTETHGQCKPPKGEPKGPVALIGPRTPGGTVESATTMIRVSTGPTVALVPAIVGRVLPANIPTPVGVVADFRVMTGEPVERTNPPGNTAAGSTNPFAGNKGRCPLQWLAGLAFSERRPPTHGRPR